MKKKIIAAVYLLGVLGLAAPVAVRAENEPNGTGYVPEEEEAPGIVVDGAEALAGNGDVPSQYVPDLNTLPAVRAQGSYETCWAFSSLGLQEIRLKNAGKGDADLSELQLAYYTTHLIADPLNNLSQDSVQPKYSNWLSMGGNYAMAYQTLAAWRGMVTEDTVPYGNASQVQSAGLSDDNAYSKDSYHLKNVYKINYQSNQAEIKEAILSNGAVGISYYDDTNGGSYNSTYNSYCASGDTQENHAVVLVGWDDSFPAEQFNNRPSSNGAWLARNSWGGSGYERNGYFWISYADPSIAANTYVMEAEGADNYDYNYQYDGSVLSKTVYQTGSFTAANVFTVSGDAGTQKLEAVSFDTGTASQLDYDVKIYQNLTDGSNPESGTLVSETQGETQFAGYYTAELDTPVTVCKGDSMAVVIQFTSRTGGKAGVAAENSSSNAAVVATAGASAGQSFYKQGSSWVDYGAAKGCNLRIKAFTTAVSDSANNNNNSNSTDQNQAVDNGGDVLGYAYGVAVMRYDTRRDGGNIILADDGDIRYVLRDGQIAKNCYLYDGSNTFYLGYDGKPYKNILTYSMDGHLIYFDAYARQVFNQFIYCENAGFVAYFDCNGYAYQDQVTFAGGNAYYLNAGGQMQQNGWFWFANGQDLGFANWDGTLVTNRFSYDMWGRLVYFQGDGRLARGLITDGTWYYNMDPTDGHCLGMFRL